MRKFLIKSILREADDIRSFLIEPADEDSLSPAEPGSHIDVFIDSDLIRQYSICNGPADVSGYQIAVKLDKNSRGGSRALHHEKAVGDYLMVGEPRNNFSLTTNSGKKLLIAGGIGITPLISMAKYLLAKDQDFELHYFARASSEMAFLGLLEQERFRDIVHLHPGVDRENTRRILIGALCRQPENSEVYTCGPDGFMKLVTELGNLINPGIKIYQEHFSSTSVEGSRPNHEFVIRLKKSNLEFVVPPGKSITRVLLEKGHAIETSCEQGICGTCVSIVLDGIPDHRDSCLSPLDRTQGRKICPCVSRSLSKILTIDR